MSGDRIPLTEVLMALSVHEGKLITRALRLGSILTGRRHAWSDGPPRYLLHGAVAGMTVTTGEHQTLGAALVTDLAIWLEPYLHWLT